MMAVRLQVPVVPMYISGLYEIYSMHDSWPRRGPIRVAIGKALVFGAGTKYEDVAERLEESIKSLRALHGM
jgi:1-acyl-sn-glycerol-3-phosphate acyltransferase